MSTIGTDAWTQNMIRAAMNNRANQMNPNNAAYWACRAQPKAQPHSPIVAALFAATVSAAATAVTIWGINKIVKIKKEKAAEEESEEESGPEYIEIEEVKSEEK